MASTPKPSIAATSAWATSSRTALRRFWSRRRPTCWNSAVKQPARPELEAVLLEVAHAYGQKVEDLVQPTRRPSEARQVGLYAARRMAGEDLRTVARRFGLGYTAVSRRVSAVGGRLQGGSRLGS